MPHKKVTTRAQLLSQPPYDLRLGRRIKIDQDVPAKYQMLLIGNRIRVLKQIDSLEVHPLSNLALHATMALEPSRTALEVST
jgi:hypothetical protein